MKHAVALSAILWLVSVEASAQTYGLGNADPALFTKFRIPETSLSSLWLNTNFYFNSQRSSNLFETGPNYNSEATNLSYGLTPRYFMMKESDDRYLALNCNLSGSYSYYDGHTEGPGLPVNTFHKAVEEGLNLNLSETLRNYASGSDLFYSAGSNLQFTVYDRHNDLPTSDSTRSTYYYGNKAQSYSLSLGFGWGKMRNVTPIVSAIRFQERLKQMNLLDSDLSEKTIEDLARQFYRQGYFSQVHVRPDKFFWEGVDRTLSSDGVSLAGLNEYAASYLREAPGELRFVRNEGLVGGVGVQLNYRNVYYSAQANPPNGSITEQLFVLGEAYVNFSHQMNLNSQISANLSATGGPDVIKHADVRQQYEISADVGYNYELTDRIVASVSNSFELMFQNYSLQGKRLINTAGLDVHYFVEDNVSLGASYQWSYLDQRRYYNSTARLRQIENYVYIGLTYYIDRGLLYN